MPIQFATCPRPQVSLEIREVDSGNQIVLWTLTVTGSAFHPGQL